MEDAIKDARKNAAINGVNNAELKVSNNRGSPMSKPRVYTMSFASVYPLYISKVEKKGRTKSEVDEIIRWLTGYSQDEIEEQLKKQTRL